MTSFRAPKRYPSDSSPERVAIEKAMFERRPTAKIVPIIDSPMEAGDQALREEFAAMINAIDAQIAALEHKIDRKIEQLIAKRNEEEGPSPS